MQIMQAQAEHIQELIEQLARRDITLWLDQGQLRYRAPKGALTAPWRQEIAGCKAELIAYLGQQPQNGNGHVADTSDTRHPLSFAQERLFFLDRLEGPSATYNIAYAWRLQGTLDRDALAQSITEIYRRHTILRASFHLDANGKPYQVLGEPEPITLPLIDVRDGPSPADINTLMAKMSMEATLPFELESAPLMRSMLFQCSEQEHYFLHVVHHIVFDGWSRRLFLQEFQTLYEAYSTGGVAASPVPLPEPLPGTLPPLPMQYIDFVHQQRETLQGEALQQLLGYWKEHLAGAPPLSTFPADWPRPAVQRHQGAHASFVLGDTLVGQLQALSQQSGTTLYMTLLTAFALLLARHSSQRDVVIGTPIANRNQQELEPLMGFFANTLPLRFHLGDEASFRTLLRQARGLITGAYAHQALPFEKLVEELQPERALNHSPLFQVMFSFPHAPISQWDLAGANGDPLRLTQVELGEEIAKFDLTLTLLKEGDALRGHWSYDRDLFAPATMERLTRHFQTLLNGIAETPDAAIARLPLFSAAERHQTLVEWNETAASYPCEQAVHQLFEAQVAETPHAVALRFGEEQLSYDELNRRANQLARHLQTLGVGTETANESRSQTLVGICLERSCEMVLGVLAILKAGGTYVPLDPDFPAERLRFMAQDAALPLVLTQSTLVDQLHLPAACQTICLDQLSEAFQRTRQDTAQINLDTGVQAEDLAYCIYTSGSTGRPKGVQIRHRNVVNFLCSMQQRPGLGAGARLVAVTTLSFDIAVLELLLPLSVGATVVIAPRQVASDGHQLAHLLEEVHATHMQATPATWQLLLAAQWLGKADLQILCGGEALPRGLAEELLPRCAALWNLYGPTETTIWSTVERVTAGDGPVPIGQPIANTQVYILDAHMEPVPVGAVGDLYIGGDGVAAGYLNRPELTQERFLPNPFVAGGSIYKTGDVARFVSTPGGQQEEMVTIEFLGRSDHQVKLRGFRIELGEIETLLAQHPHVREVAVVVHAEKTGQHSEHKQLVAYTVLHTDSPVTEENTEQPATLRAWLQEKLPDYMIPAAFVPLNALPLTPNGKVDRKTLASRSIAASAKRVASAATLIMPRTNTEVQLAEIWEEVLNVHPISVQDNFFALGGYSLLAMQVIAKIEQRMQIKLPLGALFTSPTIAQMSALIKQEVTSLNWSPLVSIQSQGEQPPLFCISGVGGNVYLFYELAHALGTERPFYGLQSVGLDGEAPPLTTVEETAACYIHAIRQRYPTGPYYIGGYSFGGHVAFEMARQLAERQQEVGMVAILDTPAPNPNRPPAMDADDTTWLLRIVDMRERIHGKRANITVDELASLSLNEQFQFVNQKLLAADLPAFYAENSQFHSFLQVYKANSMMRYVPAHPIDIPLTVLYTEANRQHHGEPSLGWQRYLTYAPTCYPLEGNHDSMLRQPNVQILAQQVIKSLVGERPEQPVPVHG